MSKIKIQRNERCPCGSGKKYKQCCALVVADSANIAGGALASQQMDLSPLLSVFNAGLMPEAAEIADRILQIDPRQCEALHLRGLIDFHNGDFSAAVTRIREAILLNPLESRYFYNLGTALLGINNQLDAIEQFRTVIKLDPANADAYGNLAAALHILGRYEEAKQCHLKVIEIKPDDPAVLTNYSSTLNANKQFKEAIPFLVKALASDPDHVDALNNLGLAALRTGMVDEAETLFKRAIELSPRNSTAHFNLAATMEIQCRLEESIKSNKDGLGLRPSNAVAHSNLLLSLLYSSRTTLSDVFDEHVRFAKQFEKPLKSGWRPHLNSRDCGRRLKIGYVSADMRNHSLAFFIEPILQKHDKLRFEIFCYYSHPVNDTVTDRLASYVEHWLQCDNLSDECLADRIRQDEIDILVDLSGHTGGNRMLTFARKPAPIQVTWIGYPGTTGLDAMDYRLTDHMMDPIGMTEPYHSEKLWRLPVSVKFYPFENHQLINDLPALSSGNFMFSCLNNIIKITIEAIKVWSKILFLVPNSKLMLGNISNKKTEAYFEDMFSKEGIDKNRLIFLPRMSIIDYLKVHQKIDLALDTFPYNGGTTTIYSLSMGVPVITLAGNSPASRCGMTNLNDVGLTDFIAYSIDEYVQKALYFSENLTKLNFIRQALKEEYSPNSEASDPLIRSTENAFLQMWDRWIKEKRI
ncbi:MAG: protein O-GlcNAc transferase [Bradyrhizobium sp.]|jgi:protein O-GlcNAc transferase